MIRPALIMTVIAVVYFVVITVGIPGVIDGR